MANPIEDSAERTKYIEAARQSCLKDIVHPIPVHSNRYYLDLTKSTFQAFLDFHVIRDKERSDAIVALCPINPGLEKVCEGQFSFAPVVVRALLNLDDAEAM